MSTNNNSFLIARDLTRVFGSDESQVVAVNNVNIEVRVGEFLAVVGRSGSGKTTLLNLLSGLDKPTNGQVLFEGQDLAELPDRKLVELRRHRFSFIFQSFALLTLLSAFENVELPLRIQGLPWADRRTLANEALASVGLAGRAHHRPYELSGGEQQRLAVARALVTSPSIIFADEPTGELDSATSLAIAQLLRRVVDEQKITILIATHDISLAGIGDRIIELVDGAIAKETLNAAARR